MATRGAIVACQGGTVIVRDARHCLSLWAERREWTSHRPFRGGATTMAAAIMEQLRLLEPSTQSVGESQEREPSDGKRLFVRARMVPGSDLHQ